MGVKMTGTRVTLGSGSGSPPVSYAPRGGSSAGGVKSVNKTGAISKSSIGKAHRPSKGAMGASRNASSVGRLGTAKDSNG